MVDLQEQIRLKERDLSSDSVAKRREAAYFMGESANESAIGHLLRLYEEDPDASVRSAAAYALGMFKAVGEAYSSSDPKDGDRAEALVRRVQEEGKLGRRASGGGLKTLVAILGVVFVLLVLANLFLPIGRPINVGPLTLPLISVNAGPTTVPETVDNRPPQNPVERAAVVARVQPVYTSVLADVQTIRGQYQGKLGGAAFNCAAFFNNAAPISLTAAETTTYPEIARIVNAITQAQGAIQQASIGYENECFNNVPLGIADVGPNLAPLQVAVTELEASAVGFAAATAVPTNAPTATAGPTNTPEPPTVTPTPAGANPAEHINALYAIIDEVTALRGANGLLTTYWNDVNSAGSTTGCQVPRPAVPSDYILPAADRQNVPTLADAVVQVNTGLQLVRQNEQLFQTACASGQLAQNAPTGLIISQTAKNAFDNANAILNTLR